MHEEPGIEQHDHPLCFWVQSNTDFRVWYIVDLSQIGSEGNPKGECDCIAGQMARNRAANGKGFRLCAHLQRARAFVAEKIAQGDYDQYLNGKLMPIMGGRNGENPATGILEQGRAKPRSPRQ